ncbi:unnamed protein product [Aspergillus oryzae]|uniref:Unnamed protein product n=2 Tax=Aspergillus oryzae TaxID=5062 RepID=A0AAN5BSB9_ASPOZ|nr:unnamed protein product [Aspergillus oryzae]GMF83752.1 unnamed protein product [Aspergillus oryzae]GMG06097.1 unnamed protein product [Aspergillus oryzae]GMG23537.1 unnamed protein product [Aspergillus oryzae]GMG52031.1 unnamed protein product [Aspergillus oryzae var. brunneus]
MDTILVKVTNTVKYNFKRLSDLVSKKGTSRRATFQFVTYLSEVCKNDARIADLSEDIQDSNPTVPKRGHSFRSQTQKLESLIVIRGSTREPDALHGTCLRGINNWNDGGLGLASLLTLDRMRGEELSPLRYGVAVMPSLSPANPLTSSNHETACRPPMEPLGLRLAPPAKGSLSIVDPTANYTYY